jgi:hypothetical protein
MPCDLNKHAKFERWVSNGYKHVPEKESVLNRFKTGQMTDEEANNEDNNAKTLLAESFNACVNDGIILGLKHSLESLNYFLDRKVEKGYPEYISRTELQTFLETYIKDVEEDFR